MHRQNVIAAGLVVLIIGLVVTASFSKGVGPVGVIDSEVMRPTAVTDQAAADKQKNERTGMTDKIEKTEEEWRKELSPEQYHVLREAGTERAFTGAYWDNHEKGIYYCAACKLALFDSETKFESGTGWPSFYKPIADSTVLVVNDLSFNMVRDEVMCRRCG